MKSLNFKKYFAFIFLLIISGIVFVDFQKDFYPEKTVADYYEVLNSKTKFLKDESISSGELEKLAACGGDSNCLEKLFYDFNILNTLERTFSKLSYLLKEYPDYSDNCHMIAHGIGNSEFVKQGNDLGKALLVFDTGKYFENIASCGSGYFHGLIEAAVKDIKDKDSLVEKFTNICSDTTVKKIAGNDCIHGLGHATFIQTDYKLEDSLYVCDKLASNEYDRFNCYDGIFMEAVLSLPETEFLTTADNGKFNFPYCSPLTNQLQRSACYFETSLLFRNVVENRNDFGEVMGLCHNMPDDITRMACVKNVSTISVGHAKYQDLEKMCLQNGFLQSEQVMCVAVFANRLALSITKTKTSEYFMMANDVCKYLGFNLQRKCSDLVKENSQQLYLTTAKDLVL